MRKQSHKQASKQAQEEKEQRGCFVVPRMLTSVHKLLASCRCESSAVLAWLDFGTQPQVGRRHDSGMMRSVQATVVEWINCSVDE